jgi:hypothetical protein
MSVVADAAALIRDVRRHPEGAYVRTVGHEDAPWHREWDGLLLVSGRLSLLIPVIGEWPLGPGVPCETNDLGSVRPEDLLPCLERLLMETNDDADRPTFVAADASAARIVEAALPHVEWSSPELTSGLMPTERSIIAEVGLSERGVPILWIETKRRMLRIPLPERLTTGIMRDEPIILEAERRAEYEFADEGTPSVVLSPSYDDHSGRQVVVTVPDAIEILRMMSRRGDDQGLGEGA